MKPNPKNTWRCTAPRWKREVKRETRKALDRMVKRYEGAMRERAENARKATLALFKKKRRRAS